MAQLEFDYNYRAKRSRLRMLARPFAAVPFILLLNLSGISGIFSASQKLLNMNMLSPSQEAPVSEINNYETEQSNPSNPTAHTSAQKKEDTASRTESIEHKAWSLPTKVTSDEPWGWSRIKVSIGLLVLLPYSLLLFLFVLDASIMFFTPSFLSLPLDALILCRRSYPEWMHYCIIKMLRIVLHYKLYIFSIADRYPSFSNEDPEMTLTIPPYSPPSSRWLPITRRIAVFPNLLVLLAINIIWLVIYVPMWVYCCTTGTMPHWYHLWTVGILRWSLRITCYAGSYLSNQYPPLTTRP